MVKKNKKKVKYSSSKTWKKFTKDTIAQMATSKFLIDNEVGEIEVTMTQPTIKAAADDVLAGFSLLELAHKYGLEEKDAKAIYDAVAERRSEENSGE